MVWLVLVVGGGCGGPSRLARTMVGSVLRRRILLLLFLSIVACGHQGDREWRGVEKQRNRKRADRKIKKEEEERNGKEKRRRMREKSLKKGRQPSRR